MPGHPKFKAKDGLLGALKKISMPHDISHEIKVIICRTGRIYYWPRMGAAYVKNIWLLIWLVLLSRVKIITVYYFVLLRLLLKIITSYFSEIAI